MTQAQFGMLLRAHPSTVSRWEATPPVIVPDQWQLAIMQTMAQGYAKQPNTADVAVAYLDAGMVGLALGTLLGAAVQGETTPTTARRP